MKISPTYWTLDKMKIIPRDSLTLSKSHGIISIFMSVQKVGEILVGKTSNFLSGAFFWRAVYLRE